MIPTFSESGVLPPYLGDGPTARADMSPYQASMSELVKGFGLSESRVVILRGLVAYRAALAEAGIDRGFQWIDGSFVESVEQLRGRPPKDVDIVTFAHRPKGIADWPAFVQAKANLFSPSQTRQHFHCDAYFVDLDKRAELIVDDTRYWYGLFSHQRSSALWKGMVSVSLRSDDQAAATLI